MNYGIDESNVQLVKSLIRCGVEVNTELSNISFLARVRKILEETDSNSQKAVALRKINILLKKSGCDETVSETRVKKEKLKEE